MIEAGFGPVVIEKVNRQHRLLAYYIAMGKDYWIKIYQ
jgi:hypothetical protein